MSKDFSAWLDEYLRWLSVERNYSPATVSGYRRELIAFQDFLREKTGTGQGKELDPAAVDRKLVRAYIAKLARNHKPATVERAVSALRSFYRFLMREGALKHNPAALVRTPKKPKRLPPVLTVDEMFALLEKPDENTKEGRRDRAILELFYASGIRLSELVSLDVDDLDLKSRLIRVRGKGNKERVVPVNQRCADLLQAVLRDRPSWKPRPLDPDAANALFLSRQGRRISKRRVELIVRDWAKKAGLAKKAHPHMLRHSFATHLLGSDMSIRNIQELLGHESLSTTQKYAHTSIEKLAVVYDKAHPRAKEKEDDKRNHDPDGPP